MKLSDIPNVRVDREHKQKYILARVCVADSQDTDEKWILYGDFGARRHYNIYRHLGECGLSVREVNGGGRIQVLHESRSIYLWDFSREYGYVDRIIATELLAKQYPGYVVTVGTPPGHDPKEDK